jgi:photosystem II stability/assembly factor-like uncharacterized protein
MKNICFLFFFTFISSYSYSQPWLKNLPADKSKNEYTFFDYQHAFESSFAAHPLERERGEGEEEKESDDGWMQFKRWEYKMQGQINKVTGEFPKKTAQEVCNEFYKSHGHARSGIASNWTSLGPDFSYGGYAGIGRLNCVAFHPTDLNTYWVGAAAGGLWVTHDNGGSWTCLTDHNGVLAVSDIIVPEDYDSSRTIYIATGDREIWDNRSVGVLKSTDEGNTWNATGLTFSVYDNAMVNRLLIDPNDPNVLLAATSWGVYKTEDGGETWDHQLTSTEYIDMEYKPGDFNVISGSTKYGQIYYTDNGGNTWSRPFNDPDARRIELAVSPQQPNLVYALAAADDAGLHGIFKSEDYGVTYTQVFYRDSANLLTWAVDGSEGGGQGWYDLCLAASPTNANTLMLGGVNTWRSIDGGSTWTIVSHWSGDQVQAVHADKHNIRYRYNGDVFECNDGGLYLSRSNGAGWADKSNGIVISEMYKLGVSQTEPGDVITGLQDNGTKSLSGGDWQDVIGGDGMECWIDYTDANVQYGTLYFGALYRTDDHWIGSVDITPYDAGDGAWVTPYAIDPVDPNIIYGGFYDLWQSTDKGASWHSMTSFNSSSLLQNVMVAPSDNQVLYVADASAIRRTTDLGGAWKNIRFNLPSDLGSIASIAVKHDDPLTVWVALSGFNGSGVYQYSNTDSTWSNISAGLPPIPVYSVVENKQSESEIQLFAGTELGIYLKKGNEDWVPYVNGLPNVRIGELEMYYDPKPWLSKLRAATYGRGLWESPVPTAPAGGIAITITAACFNQSAVVQLADYFGNIQWQESMDGVSGWENVTDGSGAHESAYSTGSLTTTMYYRAEVDQPEFAPAYSSVTAVPIIPFPADAGPIGGSEVVCEGTQGQIYIIQSIPNATSYDWILPNGVTGASTSNFIQVDFESAGFKEIQVSGKNGECEGVPSSIFITVNPKPAEFILDSIAQPTCTTPTGSVYLSGLPDAGNWTLTNLTDSTTIAGEGSQFAIQDLSTGAYQYGIANSFGCYFPSEQIFTILSQPPTPPTPVITYNAFELHSDALVGNQWYDENGSIPGATGQDYTALEGGDYYVIVTVDGCASAASNIIQLFNEGVGNGPQSAVLQVFPNPIKNEMTIEASGDAIALDFEILNALGQHVISGSLVHQVVINTASFPSGLYLVKVAMGQEVVMKKVVKE